MFDLMKFRKSKTRNISERILTQISSKTLKRCSNVYDMCRFAAYLGHPLKLSQLITEPAHSLIHQSYKSQERPEPLNGDGFGVAWFVPEISPIPALFKDITPAWNNENLRELARVTTSQCILAHVRAASPNSAVQRLNCHPFVAGHLAFMHNGFLAGFDQWRRPLLASLSDTAFQTIRGSTDSEHALAVLWDLYCESALPDPLERLAQSLLATIQQLERLKNAAGINQVSYLNFAVSDGHRLVATRYSSHPDNAPASLHYTSGRNLRCEHGKIRLDSNDQDPDVVLIVSEETGPEFCWEIVPPNHIVLAQHPGQIELRPIDDVFSIARSPHST